MGAEKMEHFPLPKLRHWIEPLPYTSLISAQSHVLHKPCDTHGIQLVTLTNNVTRIKDCCNRHMTK